MLLSERITGLIERVRCLDDTREIAAILYVDAQARIIDTRIMEGASDHLDLPMAQILQQGRALRASRLLMLHTHPSGNPRPSPHDMTTTRLLCARLRRQGQKLADHIILTRNAYFSFRANRML